MAEKKLVERHHDSFLARHEKTLLVAIARRLPAWLMPDGLTAIGLLGAVLVFAGYVLTNLSIGWVWLANFGLLLNWFGDSLDGTVARHRKIERPRYGFFLDHSVDTVSIVLIGLGAGLSVWLRFDFVLMVVIGYLMLATHTFVRSVVTGRMHVDAMGFGPTEMRIGIFLGNLLLSNIAVSPHRVWGVTGTAYDLLVLVTALFLYTLFAIAVVAEARTLKRGESS